MAAITITTNVTPPITIPLDGGGSNPLIAWLQPTVSASLPIVGDVNYAPYGAALPLLGTLVTAGLLVILILGVLRLFGR